MKNTILVRNFTIKDCEQQCVYSLQVLCGETYDMKGDGKWKNALAAYWASNNKDAYYTLVETVCEKILAFHDFNNITIELV